MQFPTLEANTSDAPAPHWDFQSTPGAKASTIELPTGGSVRILLSSFWRRVAGVPPTKDRIERMLRATDLDPHETIGRIPPCNGKRL